MSNYLSISINDATFDLNITLNTMVECDPLRFYYCNLFEEYQKFVKWQAEENIWKRNGSLLNDIMINFNGYII